MSTKSTKKSKLIENKKKMGLIEKTYNLDKYINDDIEIIIGTNNKTYSIVNHNDGYGEKLFSSIEIGRTYKFIVREPELTDINQNTHILQVHNVTNSNT